MYGSPRDAKIHGEMTCGDSKLGLLAEKAEAGLTFVSQVNEYVQFWVGT